MTELEIVAFLTVVKTGSITSASEALFITQPALSRRISTLEKELGFRLIERGKGLRSITLTDKGSAFISVANKWKLLFEETREISKLDSNLNLNVTSIESLMTYILPNVFQKLLADNESLNLSIHSNHSYEAYNYVESGLTDIAFVSDPMYSKNIDTTPAFREPMLLVAGKHIPLSGKVHPSQLDASYEIKIPWSPQFNIWHDYWFGASSKPKVILDEMSMMEYFLDTKNTWAILPISIIERLPNKANLKVLRLLEGPPDRIIYYLLGKQQKATIKPLLNLLNQQLKNIDGIVSYIK